MTSQTSYGKDQGVFIRADGEKPPEPPKKEEPPLVPTCGRCGNPLTKCQCQHNKLEK